MALKEWVFNVHDTGKGQVKMPSDSTGWLMICSAGLATSPTIYINQSGSNTLTKINTVAVMSIASGYTRFWTDQSVTSLDISFLLSTGESGYLLGATPSTHMLYINSVQPSIYKLWVPFAFLASSAEVDTTLDLAGDLIVTDCEVLVKTLEAADTLDVGILSSEANGDADGFLDAILCTTAGIKTGNGVLTGGTNIDYVSMANGRYGALLADAITGTDSVAGVGGITRKNYLTDGVAKSLTYTPSNSSVMNGFIIVSYLKAMG